MKKLLFLLPVLAALLIVYALTKKPAKEDATTAPVAIANNAPVAPPAAAPAAAVPAVETTTENAADKEIAFFGGRWAEALARSAKENKPVFLDIYATWCGPCKLLKKETFVDKNVAKFYNANFINVTLDGEKGEGLMLAEKFQITGYPTLLIIDANGNKKFEIAGFLEPNDFIEFGKQGLAAAKK